MQGAVILERLTAAHMEAVAVQAGPQAGPAGSTRFTAPLLHAQAQPRELPPHSAALTPECHSLLSDSPGTHLLLAGNVLLGEVPNSGDMWARTEGGSHGVSRPLTASASRPAASLHPCFLATADTFVERCFDHTGRRFSAQMRLVTQQGALAVFKGNAGAVF